MLIDEGVSPEDIIRLLYSEILRLNISEKEKIYLSDHIGEIDYRLTQGARPEIQLSVLLAKLAIVGKDN
jgi:DNA polymerase III delta prime subunit